MPTNSEISALLTEMASMLEILGEDSFRASAHARAGRTIGDLSSSAESLTREQLLKLDGIGAKMADKIVEFVTTGRVAEYDELASRLPKGLLELSTIPGVGPKTVRLLWQEGGITDLASLKAAIADGSLLKLPRMGEKSVAKIRSSIAVIADANRRAWLGKADAIARRFVDLLSTLPAVSAVTPAGSLRRGKETVGDIDILVSVDCAPEDLGATQKRVAEAFRAAPGVQQVLVAGDNKSSVRVALDGGMGRWRPDAEGSEGTIQVDLRVLPSRVFGAALSYFTGSKEHNVALRERALKMGLTLNEWGLFPNDSEETPPQSRGIAPIAAETEQAIYAALKLPYIPPEIREDRGEMDLKATPRLVELADIRAELHAHTTASDGTMSIEELARRAMERGFHTIAVTDHSRSSGVANGLSIERLLAHIDAVRAAQKLVPGIAILAGSEVDILADGGLDYPDEILAQLDIVVASPHAALSQDPATATARLVRAIEHPRVNILGHPTGRLINKRAGLSPDMGALIAAAKA
ncbi:MAG: helix-hairpin-helix domain-containing protein, partial [Phycisphaerales bacterium]